MVEEMFHQTPEQFKQFNKKFKFFSSESPPIITTEVIPNYAYGIHSDANDQCCGFDNFHYHIIAETTTDLGKQKKYTVPCLYSTYKHLLYNSTDHFFAGDLMKQLNNAVNYNQQYPPVDQQPNTSLRRRLPLLCAVQKQHNNTQTNIMPSETFDRVLRIINSNLCGDFCRILDILLSGYGVLCIDSNEKTIKFEFELKNFT